MSDLLIRRTMPLAARLAMAVADEDPERVHELLTPLSREQLYAVAVVLADQVAPPQPGAYIRECIRLATHLFATNMADVLEGSKRREAVDARAVACHAAHLLGASYSLIGRQVGRDHSTVMHACARVGESPALRRAAQRIAAQLGWDPDLELPLEREGA